MSTTNASEKAPALPAETRVLSTLDGEPGSILSSYAFDASGWTEYEVVTQYGIEIWRRAEFLLLDEVERELEVNG